MAGVSLALYDYLATSVPPPILLHHSTSPPSTTPLCIVGSEKHLQS